MAYSVALSADGGCVLLWTSKTFWAFAALPLWPRKTHDFAGISRLPNECHCSVNKAQDSFRKVELRLVIFMLL